MIGNQPSLTGNVASKTISVTATSGQTLFTVQGGYRINQLSVYRNGVKLTEQDYSARDGSSVTLLSPATLGDTLEFQVFDDFRVADALSVNSGGTVNGNVNVVGSVSASGGFVGNLTGTASTASFSTTAFGLSGTPNLNVGVVTASSVLVGSAVTINSSGIIGGSATFTNLTVNGTQTIINTTNLEISDPLIGIGSGNTTDAQANGDGIQIYGATNKTLTYNDTKKGFETNIPWSTNETRVISGAEKVHRQSGNTVTLTYNSSSSSNVGYTTNPTGDITVNVVGIPTTSDFDDHSITFAVIVNSTGTARTCTTVNLNGVSRTIRWAGGSLASAISGVTTTTGHSIFSFTGINTVGSASTAANYTVFGVTSGGFF